MFSMKYVARFEEIEGVLFRFDTRIYLGAYDPSAKGVCVGAIVGKNPGSAAPQKLGELAALELKGDKMLPTVGNRFLEAFELARKQVPVNAFVRVWNLFYVCNKDLGQALMTAAQLSSRLPMCESEGDAVPVVWFGWGDSDAELNPFKRRFLAHSYQQAFFYDGRQKKVIGTQPKEGDFAKHTQGMPAALVNAFLATLV